MRSCHEDLALHAKLQEAAYRPEPETWDEDSIDPSPLRECVTMNFFSLSDGSYGLYRWKNDLKTSQSYIL